MSPKIAPIVEGKSEVDAVPVLLRRLLEEKGSYDIEIARPFRVKRYKVVKAGELERAIKLTQQDREDVDGIILLLDSDDDAPADLQRDLLKRAKKAAKAPVVCVLAVREMECWFLGAKESLRGFRGIKNDAIAPIKPESIRGAKEELSNNMEKGRQYIEVDDQPAFAAKMDFQMARQRCPSFQNFEKELARLLGKIRGKQG